MTLAETERPSSKQAAARPAAELISTLDRMKAAARKAGPPDYDTRIELLDKLEQALLTKKHDLAKAVSSDFGNRSAHETLSGEIMVVVNELKHVRAHLHEWMETEPREVSWMFLPARAEIVMQPVGVVGIVSPWNYPIQLSLAPLVGVLAAGNRAILKPSEIAPAVADALKSLIAETFSPDWVTVVTGGTAVAEAFTHLPFDHLVFTGSPRLGKIVMRAAAENLVPVTLELGGKSPAIVGESFSSKLAADKIMFGKCFNAGQTCVAPDYAFLPKARLDSFVEECKAAVAKMYPRLGDNRDYTSIVSEAHYNRLQGYLKDARDRGAKVIELNPAKEELSESSRKIAPTLVLGAKEESLVLQEEIFGPILPVLTYEKLDEAIDYVNDHPRPLALYYFEDSQRRIDRVLRETISGGVTINDTMLHVIQADLPFGGAGTSGIGAYHGRDGFEAFTKKKPVFYQSRISGTALFMPPYKEKIDWILKTLLGK
jgi:coniferyl-aldehyde dehydrogenase